MNLNEFDGIFVTIANHNNNGHAIQLKNGFEPFCKTVLIDSGSDIKPNEIVHFDHALRNVYYSGLLNKGNECFQASDKKILLFITSDVRIADFQKLLYRIKLAFDKFNAGVYAPSAINANHPQMKPGNSQKLKRTTFAEGFCFAVERRLIDTMCPIDTKINFLGHGLDIYLGYLAMKYRKYSLIDQSIVVFHAEGTGYNSKEAFRQNIAWFEGHDEKARRFKRLAFKNFLRNRLGLFLIWALTIDRKREFFKTLKLFGNQIK